MKKLISRILLVLAILQFSQGNLYAFDGTDTTPPELVSMRQLSLAPNSNNELIVIEVLTQDDKNWVKISGTPQIGYSYALTNPSAAPNCATVTTSFSKFEILEDESYRNGSNGSTKKQRFIMLAFAPKPKPLPGNCPEYRNLTIRPIVALNTTSFLRITNKNSKTTTLASNLLTPAIQDESGRITNSKPYQGIIAENLSYANQSVGTTSLFCLGVNLLPRNNTTIANAQAKYLTASAKALDENIVFIADPVIEMYEAQVNIWTKLSLEVTPTNYSAISSCAIPLTAQQISNAYSNTSKSIDNLITDAAKAKLNLDCQALNTGLQNAIDFVALLKYERLQSAEYSELMLRSKTLRVMDCSKVTSKIFTDSTNLLNSVTEVRDKSSRDLLVQFCDIRNAKKDKFGLLLANMIFRYKNVNEFKQWRDSAELENFTICDLDKSVTDLLILMSKSNALIVQINGLLAKFQSAERTKSIAYTIQCKSGKKSVLKTGRPPKCPNGYQEVRLTLNKVS